MKTQCTEQSRHGNHVTVNFLMPDEEGFPAQPEIQIDILDLLVEEEAGRGEHTLGLFVVDAMALLSDAPVSQQEADALAEWLEGAAKQIRAKFRHEPAATQEGPSQ